MAKRKYQIDSKGKPQVPWHEEYTLAHFESREDFEEHLNYMLDQWEEIGARLRPGQPHPLAYPQQWEDENYKADMGIWQHEEAMERQRAKHEPRREAPPMHPDLRAIYRGKREDGELVKKRFEARRIMEEHLSKAAEHEALGHQKEAREDRERAGQWHRELKRLERETYSFQEQENEEAVQFGDRTLSEMLQWSAQKLEENFDTVTSMVDKFRGLSESEHSFVLTGSGPSLRLSKIKHPGIPAKDLPARVGDIGDENLLLRLGVHGVESRTEPEAEKEAPEPSLKDATMADYEAHVQKQEAKGKEKSFAPEVAPGMFGG